MYYVSSGGRAPLTRVAAETARNALSGSQVLRTRLERCGDAQGGAEREHGATRRGPRPPPRSDVLPALAKALGVKVEEILGDAPVNAARRPGPVGKLQKIFEQAVSLPRKEQELVAKFVATLLEQHKKAS